MQAFRAPTRCMSSGTALRMALVTCLPMPGSSKSVVAWNEVVQTSASSQSHPRRATSPMATASSRLILHLQPSTHCSGRMPRWLNSTLPRCHIPSPTLTTSARVAGRTSNLGVDLLDNREADHDGLTQVARRDVPYGDRGAAGSRAPPMDQVRANGPS